MCNTQNDTNSLTANMGACFDAIDRIRSKVGGLGLKYFIETYGCQMNEHDSEKIAGMLVQCGYEKAETKQEADFILFNTCCVREHAELRTFGNVGFVKELKQINPRLILGVCGCMMQQEGVAEKLYKRFPFVDIIFGTHELQRFPLMLEKALDSQRIVELSGTDDVVEGLPVKREAGFSTFVNIMYGCNNFCTYCIVPYVRGRERSRKPQDIISEVREVVSQGFSEITLLGQNVNSYFSDGIDFPALLKMVCDSVPDLKRLRFMTSHPKDLSDGLIDAMAEIDNVCKHIHLPVQSGSNVILKAMNRRYTREHYLELVEKLRSKVKDVEITTDIIVGFPGETEEDYQDTVSLVREVGYSNAYTFAYSLRAGTVAAKMENQVPAEVKKRRLNQLNAVLAETIPSRNARYIGYTGDILVEGIDHRAEPLLFGKLSNFKMVYVEGDEKLIGSFVKVRVDGFRFNSLFGHIID